MANHEESQRNSHRQSPDRTTRSFAPEGSRATHTAASEPGRIVLVVGSGRQHSHDLYQLLLRRLRIFSSIMAVVLAGVMALTLWNLYTAMSAGRLDELGGRPFVRFSLISIGLPLFVAVSSAAVLRLRPPATTPGLRAIELAIVGSVAIVMLWGMAYPQEWYTLLERRGIDPPLLEQRAFTGVYVEFTSLRWFALLVAYGALIPNTWRRCAVVVTVLALSPLVMFALLSLWLRPLDTEVVVTIMSGLALLARHRCHGPGLHVVSHRDVAPGSGRGADAGSICSEATAGRRGHGRCISRSTCCSGAHAR